MQDVVTVRAASACGKGGQQHCRPYIFYARRSAVPSGPMWLPAGLPSACAKVPAAPAGNISLASDAESCHCAGVASGERCRTRASGRVCQRTALPSAHARWASRASRLYRPLRAVQHSDIAPEAITYGAAISGWQKCQQHPQGVHLLRAWPRHVIVPGVIVYSAACGVCDRASSTGGPCVPRVRCGAMSSSRTWSPAVQPSAGAISASSH